MGNKPAESVLTFLKSHNKNEYYFSWMIIKNQKYEGESRLIKLQYNPCIIDVIRKFTNDFTLSYDVGVENVFKGFTTDSIKIVNNVMENINCEWVRFFQSNMRIYCEFKSMEMEKLMIMMLPLFE